MAHVTDYQSTDKSSHLSRLSKSPSSMNPSSHKNIYDGNEIDNANILVYNFLRSNPNWAIDSLVSYLLKTYVDYGVTRKIIASQIHNYILSKDPI